MLMLTAMALVAGACASGEESGQPDDTGGELLEEGITSGLVNVQDTVEPVDGGTLTMGTFSPVRSLDPTVITGSGTAGGIELAAIYDVLMRYDRDAQAFRHAHDLFARAGIAREVHQVDVRVLNQLSAGGVTEASDDV